jgi:hypothetical protein
MAAEHALATYTGQSASQFDVVSDPMVRGVWAARDAQGNHYLIHANEEIEECQFQTWPPSAIL